MSAPTATAAVADLVAAMPARTVLRRVFARGPWERTTATLIGVGFVMLTQPLSLTAYSYSFTVLLAGVVGYSIAGHLPE